LDLSQLTLEEATEVKQKNSKISIIKKIFIFGTLMVFLLSSIFTHIFIKNDLLDANNQTIIGNFSFDNEMNDGFK
jgi:hypothetical protein